MTFKDTLKYYGRNLVLPADKIKNQLTPVIVKNNITQMVIYCGFVQ